MHRFTIPLLAGLLGAITVAYTQLNNKPLVLSEATQTAKYHNPFLDRAATEPQVDTTVTRQIPAKGVNGYANPPSKKAIAALEAAFARSRPARDNAQRLFRAGKFKAAEAECRRAMTLAPLISGKPWYTTELPLLGDILLAQGRNSESLKCYLSIRTSSVPDDPQHPRPNLNAALAYCRMGNFKMAKKYCPPQAISSKFSPELLKDLPSTDNIRALEAILLLIRGRDLASSCGYEGGLPYLKAANKLLPHNWIIAYDIGDSLHHLNRREEAISYYRTLIQLRGDKTPYRERMRVEMYDLAQKQKRK